MMDNGGQARFQEALDLMLDAATVHQSEVDTEQLVEAVRCLARAPANDVYDLALLRGLSLGDSRLVGETARAILSRLKHFANDPEVEALIAELKGQLENESLERTQRTVTSTALPSISELSVDELVDLVAARVCAWLEERMRSSERLRPRLFTGDQNVKDIHP